MTLAAAYAHDALLPRAPGGNGAGAVLALAVHAGLIVALTVSVDWRAHPVEVVSAELWDSVPQVAAPAPAAVAPPAVAPPVMPPAPPPPAPVQAPPAEPDIATERAERRKAEAQKKQADAEAERQRASAEKAKEKQKAEAEQAAQREARATEQRLAKLREENLKRMMGQAGSAIDGASTTGTAAQDAAPSAAYQSRLAELIRGNSVYTGDSPDNAPAVVEVRAGPSGTIIARRLVKSSGVPEWDDAVLRAIDKTATLPRDADGRVPPLLTIAFRPKR